MARLEQKLNSIGSFYESKVKELVKVIQKQQATKQELERELSILTK
jgi:hypothetical protein